MAKLGEVVTFHTVDGPCAALVIGHTKDGDNDHELAVFANSKTKNDDTGLTDFVNYRTSHADDKPGGFTS